MVRASRSIGRRTMAVALRVALALALLAQFGLGTAQAAPPPESPTIHSLLSPLLGDNDQLMCANVKGGSTANSALVIQYQCTPGYDNQNWRFVPLSNGFYRVVAVHSNKCLHVAGGSRADSANVIQSACIGGAANQEWRLEPVSPGAELYLLQARHSLKCLNVPRASGANGVPLIQYTCDRGALNNLWYLDDPW